MSSRPAVSVVTIFYQAERFLAEAIESALAQTGCDFELVLVDDGSTDGGPRIAAEYARRDPRVRLVSHPFRRNRGMSASRNRGARAARGEWLAFLDADDVWLPGKLRHQLERLAAHPEAAALVAPAEWWYSWSAAREERDRDFVQRWSVPLGEIARPPALLEMFLADEWASICDLVLRRSLYRELGGYESAFRGMYEDQVFHAKLCLTEPVYVAAETGYRYRQHEDSCVAKSHAGGATATRRRHYLEWLARHAARAAPASEIRAEVARQLAALPAPPPPPSGGWARRWTGSR